MVKLFEALSNRRYRVKRIPRAVLAFLAPMVGRLNEMAGSGMSLFAEAANGDGFATELQREIALPLTTLDEYAARTVRSAQPAHSAES